MLHKLMLAVAVLPLLGGVALAGPGGTGGSPNVGKNVNTADGPTAYANWQQLWYAARNNAYGPVLQSQVAPALTAPPAAGAPPAAVPNG